MSSESDLSALRERLKAKVVVDELDCWIWQGSIMRGHKGERTYGRLMIGTKSVLAHRASYEAFVGPIPEGLEIDHLCRNKACIKPNHLEAVTRRVNLMRAGTGLGAVAAKKTHCPKGHEYTPDSTLMLPSSRHPGKFGRVCGECYPGRRRHLQTQREHESERAA